MGTVAFAPLPFGSVETVWIAVWTIVIALSLVLAPTSRVRTVHLWVIVPFLAFVAFFGITVWHQLASAPLVGQFHPVWADAAHLLREPLRRAVSANLSAPWLSLGSPLLLALTFMAAFINTLDRNFAYLLLWTCAASAAVYGLYDIGSLAIDNGTALLTTEVSASNVITGPFINRNTAATYYGTSALLWLLLAAARLQRKKKALATSGSVDATILDTKLGVALAGFVICITANLLTQSRAGILLTLAAVVICCSLYFFRTVRGRFWLPLLLTAMTVSGIALEVWGGRIALRLGAEGLIDQGRSEIYRSTLALIKDHPLFGTGLGSFADVFPALRSDAIPVSGVWDRAHSTPLELTVEMGLPVLLSLTALCLPAGFSLFRGVFVRQRDLVIPLAGLAGGLLSMSHSLLDFSVQIPGYGVVCASVVACGLAQSFRRGVGIPASAISPIESSPSTLEQPEAPPARHNRSDTTELRSDLYGE
ncbi:O-antigen ligase family protein [Microvirga massiliensis]|uniref:O-antigen ligase family protein n=1 Tax=Microvirga massiliensis TaxID=1033741 RepID=UPI000ABA6784|nr:O-antigen ligase family protein [Microvirga massiliensis]